MTDDLASIFREELRDLLESLERGLMDLRARPDDALLVNQVFRDLHTVKGSGAMFGFTDLAAFIHDFETAFDRVRSGIAPVTPDLIRLALAARDEIPGLVDGLADPDARREGILNALRQATGAAKAADASPDEPKSPVTETTTGCQSLSFRLNGAALAVGARPELLLRELRDLGAEAIEADLSALPDLSDLDVDVCHIRWTATLPPTVTTAQVDEVFLFADADWTLEPAATDTVETVPQSADRPAPPALAAPVMPTDSAATATATAPAAATAAATVRVPAERLDALMDSVGELVTVEARLTEPR